MQRSGRDRALQYLRDKVLTDPDVQGTFLNEVELATKIGVSRTPVREALLLLVSDGLVDILPGRGAYVPPLSGRQIRDLMELRGVLERYAASKAIAAGGVPLDTLYERLDILRGLATSGREINLATATAFIEHDIVFHQAIVDAANNALLSESYAGLRVRQRRLGIVALLRGVDRQQVVCEEHRQIVDALAAGDEAAAFHAIDLHLERTLHVLLQA
jgi:DNA-binding GntR family transcriptional regulator